ncbi:MAG: hypothetical protein WCV88_05580 [Patescibacteria group bacterium]
MKINARWQFWLGCLGYVLVTIIFFWPTIFHQAVPLPTDLVHNYLLGEEVQSYNTYTRDAVVQLYPYSDYIFNSYKHWQLPLYNPYIFSGVSFFNGQSAAFSPINLLIPFFNKSLDFFTANIIIYFFLAGLGMFIFLRRDVHPGLAWAAGLAWQLSGPMIVWLEWGTIDGVLAFFPLTLWAVYKLVYSDKWYWGIPAVIFNYAMLTAGHVQFYLYALIVVVLYASFLLWQNRQHLSRHKILSLTGWMIVQGIIMVSLLYPFMVQLGLSHRALSTNNSQLSVEHLILWILPNYWGDVTHFRAPLNYVETSVYVGIIPVLFFLISLCIKKFIWQARHIFWLVIFCSVLGYVFIPNSLFVTVPPMRAIFILDFIVIILAAYFQDWLFSKKIYMSWICIGLGMLMFFDQWSVMHGYNPQQSREPLTNPPAYVQAIQQAKPQALIYSELSPVNLYGLYGIRSIFGYDSTYPQTYFKSIKQHGKIISHKNILNAKINDVDFLRSLQVDYIVTQRELALPVFFQQDGIKVYDVLD